MNVFELVAKLTLDKKGYEDALNEEEKKTKSFGSKLASGLGAAASGAGKILGTAAKATGAAVAAGAAGVTALTKQSVEAYANYEQLVGGVETLFGTGGKSIEEYAQSVGKSVDEVRDEYENLEYAQELLFAQAADGYKTAGLSANDYMEQATSFAAALVNSLGGDTLSAVEIADQAIGDMSDNANKMGTSMEAIQNAYNGFAKGNFTMLDNLKLGYGGTKEEMERLLEKAKEIDEGMGISRDYNIDNFADIVMAIHTVQTEMGIYGTTAKEATETISGSISMMKAAWGNLVTGMADDNADIEHLMDNLTDSIFGYTDEAGNHVKGVVDNLLPRIKKAMDGIGKFVSKAVPAILNKVPDMISDLLPGLLNSAVGLASSIAQQLPTLLTSLVNTLKANGPILLQGVGDLIGSVAAALPDMLFTILEQIPNLIHTISDNIFNNLPIILEGITSFIPELLSNVADIALSIIDELINHLPDIIETAGTIILALGEGLIKALPKLIAKIPEIVMAIITGLGRVLGPVGEIAVKIITGLWEGIKSGIGKLGEIISNVGKTIIDGITSLPGKVLDFAKNIIKNLWTGIQDGIGQLGKVLGDVGKAILDALAGIPKAVFDLGAMVIQGFVDGVGSLVDNAVKGVTGFFGGIVDGVANFLGIHSPSKLFAQFGQYSAEGFGIGFDKEFDSVKNDIEDSMQFDPQNIPVGDITYTTKSASDTNTLLNTLIGVVGNMSGQQIVLDTGVLVGQTVSKMDAALGNLSVKNARSVIA